MEIGEKIRKLRKSRGLTQRKLGQEINFSHSYIGDLESNRSNPSIKSLEIIAEFFGVGVGYFFDDKCCYEKLIDGTENFCYCTKDKCKSCPLKTNQDLRK
ncbi:MAG: helix-turn-helix transcriptional regulator [Tissierellaceae bacterium]|nr:helix-turn-helix transcriptional regulator [Tissierellaceae bacterium]